MRTSHSRTVAARLKMHSNLGYRGPISSIRLSAAYSSPHCSRCVPVRRRPAVLRATQSHDADERVHQMNQAQFRNLDRGVGDLRKKSDDHYRELSSQITALRADVSSQITASRADVSSQITASRAHVETLIEKSAKENATLFEKSAKENATLFEKSAKENASLRVDVTALFEKSAKENVTLIEKFAKDNASTAEKVNKDVVDMRLELSGMKPWIAVNIAAYLVPTIAVITFVLSSGLADKLQ